MVGEVLGWDLEGMAVRGQGSVKLFKDAGSLYAGVS
jgi:hypothetical protein